VPGDRQQPDTRRGWGCEPCLIAAGMGGGNGAATCCGSYREKGVLYRGYCDAALSLKGHAVVGLRQRLDDLAPDRR